jgi:hypothetical protein
MNAPWKCKHCWAQNQAHATQCSYCGKSVEETLKQNLADDQRGMRKKQIGFVIKVAFLIVLVLGLPLVGYTVWQWHKSLSQAAAADYQDRLKKDQLLDSNGTKAQCEITLEFRTRSSTSVVCTFVVGEKQYRSSGHTPLGYKMRLQRGEGGVVGIAPGNMVTVVYDPQNPTVNRMESDRLVDDAMDGPEVVEAIAAIFVIGLLVSSSIGVWRVTRRQKKLAALSAGQD